MQNADYKIKETVIKKTLEFFANCNIRIISLLQHLIKPLSLSRSPSHSLSRSLSLSLPLSLSLSLSLALSRSLSLYLIIDVYISRPPPAPQLADEGVLEECVGVVGDEYPATLPFPSHMRRRILAYHIRRRIHACLYQTSRRVSLGKITGPSFCRCMCKVNLRVCVCVRIEGWRERMISLDNIITRRWPVPDPRGLVCDIFIVYHLTYYRRLLLASFLCVPLKALC